MRLEQPLEIVGGQWIELSPGVTPDVAPAGKVRLYTPDGTALHVSVNGGAYAAVADLTAGGVTATAAELNRNAGVTPGTSLASKTAVLGTNKNLDVLALPVSGLKIGAGAGTAVSASAAELNLLTGASLTTAQLNQIMAAFGAVTFDRAAKWAKVALAALDTGGGVLAWQNPEAVSILVHRVILDVTTKSSAACTLDVGTTATNATTLSDNLIDGLDVGTSAGLYDYLDQAGANGKPRQKLAAGKWVTGSMASGAAAGLVGSAYISYLLA